MASTSIPEQDSSVIPTSLFLLSSLLLVSAASENNSHKEGEGEGEGEEGDVGDVGVGDEGRAGNVGVGEGDAGEKGQKPRVTFGPYQAQGTSPSQGPSTGPSPSTFQSPEEEEEYSKLIAAITQHYMRTYNDTSLGLDSLDTIFKHNVNNPEKLNYHLQDFGININKATNNICINFASKKKAINIKAKYTIKLTAKLEKLMNLHDQTNILKTIDTIIDTITNISDLNALLKPYAIHSSSNEICIKRKTDQDEANEAAANEEDDKAEALAAVKASIEVETEEAQTAEEVANEADEQAKAAEQAKAERAKADEQVKANKAEEAATTIQRQRRRRIKSYIPAAPLTRALHTWSAKSRNPD